ncbi:hypothetical protein AeRB84_019367 [Aphanomyces euteiches]|nr:hypothetical protein AeRB84_019367 [Aphanomyces euteiches]
MHMDVGFFINQIDEDRALRAVLHDHRNEGIDEGLADLVQLTANTNSRQLIWGLASLSAIPILENKPFKIPVKDGTQTFTMHATSAMDGFFLDILGFDAHREAKSHLWEVLHAAVRRLSPAYTRTRCRSPPMFKSNCRLIVEIILLGKCYRVYGKDWYNHRKQTQRLDLDILAREKKIPIPGSKPAQTSNNTRQTQDGKRQRVEPEPDLPWELVRKGAKQGTTDDPLPWVSPNMYQSLDERVIVSTKQVANAAGTDITILPVIFERPDAPTSTPQDAFVSGTKPHRNKAVRTKTSLNTTLDELAALDTAVAEAQASFENACVIAASKTKIKLAQYIQAGEADWIQRDLEDHPIVFRRQLRDLAVSSPHLLLPLVQLRLINRWLRASQGATLPFPKLYTETFGHSFSLENLQTDFTLLDDASQLDASSTPPNESSGDTTPIEVEIILAMAELILGSTAPMVYSSDTALYSLTAQPVFAIPSRFQSRYLASASIRHALWGTTMLGSTVWDELRKILTVAVEALNPDKAPADPALSLELAKMRSIFTRWLDVMQVMELAEEIDDLNIEPTN